VDASLWEVPEADQAMPINLPVGWVVQWSESASVPYYYCAHTGESIWRVPEPWMAVVQSKKAAAASAKALAVAQKTQVEDDRKAELARKAADREAREEAERVAEIEQAAETAKLIALARAKSKASARFRVDDGLPPRMPKGWSAHIADDGVTPYYFCAKVDASLWEVPEADQAMPINLPAGWVVQWSEEHSLPFYSNTYTGESIWRVPEPWMAVVRPKSKKVVKSASNYR